MSSYAKRLLFAAVFSLMGMLGSYGWYCHDLNKTRGATEVEHKLVARLDSAKNEVQKRSVKRVIWQRVQEEELLYSGEAVRTAIDGEAKIIFKSGTELDLDPDSVVVIEEAGDKVGLDFVKGNVVVKGNDKSSDVSLHSGNTTINLANADLTLGKSAGKNVDVQVIRGLAEVSNGSKTMTLDNEKSGTINDKGLTVAEQIIKLKTQVADDKRYVSVIDKTQKTKFNWKPLSDDYVVHLEMGTRRDELKAVGGEVSGANGEIAVVLKPGTQYWHLVAVNKKDARLSAVTPTNKVMIIADAPPKLLAPATKEVISVLNETQKVDLRWANPSKLVSLRLQVSRQPDFKTLVTDENVEDIGAYGFSTKEEGRFFWRVAGAHAIDTTMVSSEVHEFNIKTHFDLLPPAMKSPANEAVIPVESLNSGNTFFSWHKVDGVENFHFHLEKVATPSSKGQSSSVAEGAADGRYEVIIDKQIEELTQLKSPVLKPGLYRWYVNAVDKSGKESKTPVARVFSVSEIPELAWTDDGLGDDHLYASSTPTLKPRWAPDTHVTAPHYKITVKADDHSFEKVFDSQDVNEVLALPKDGIYHVSVESFDSEGHVSARTSIKDFAVAMRPLVEAPQFASRMPASIQALNNGSANFSWNAVSGAKKYNIYIKNNSGKVVKTESVDNTTSTVIKNLLPGTYKVNVAAIDSWNRPGALSAEKILTVPETSDAPPPKFKRIKVQ